MSYHDLESVIEDAVSDSQLPAEPVEEASEPVEDTPVEASEEPSEPVEQVELKDESQPETPVTAEETPAVDEFERVAGMPQMSPAGRENRIPYSRVKKITEKAVNELAEAVLGRKPNPGEKVLDVVKQHVARIPELTAKVTDYEDRLSKVGEFEDILANDPKRFIQMLSSLPAYQGFFKAVREAFQQGATPQQAPAKAQDPEDPMPEPDQELEDGSKVYSLEGLKSLLEWNSRNTEARVTRQFEARYRPIESEWKQRKYEESVMPIIRAKIEEAKAWPHFTENEEEITNVLAADKNISLEAAYQKVVFPKLLADRDKVRQEVLRELKTAPRATAVTGAKVPAKPVAAGPRSLEDVIRSEVEKIK